MAQYAGAPQFKADPVQFPFISDGTSSDKITMMQIETIILNTSLIQITEKSIPENFLKSSTNATTCNEGHLNINEKVKENFNATAAAEGVNEFQPLRKSTKFPSYFNAIDLLKSNTKK